jgi:tight adherence protein C
MLRITLGLLGTTGFFVSLFLAWRWLALRAKAQQRWFAQSPGSGAYQNDTTAGEFERRSTVGRWLYRAGYRRPTAATTFVGTTLFCLVTGTTLAVTFTLSGLQSVMEQAVVVMPGGVGETFLPIVWVAPWFICVVVSCAPWLQVRKTRRLRVEQIEQDLPLALELLSTLSEAGLGFDVGLTRILKTRLADRPLATELQLFQADMLAGRTRVESLRRLSLRVDLASVSIFVSALVQAEQLGMGIARVLRQQANDVRARRRERAIAFANSLATKRVIPLVVCFLPGLFVWTLGPAFVQLFKMADTFIQVRSY